MPVGPGKSRAWFTVAAGFFWQAGYWGRAHAEALHSGGPQTGRPEVVLDFDHVVHVVNKLAGPGCSGPAPLIY